MSDGNFNRSLLPSNNYHSGLRAGRAQMKTIALEQFKEWLKNDNPELDAAMLEQKVADYKKMLDQF